MSLIKIDNERFINPDHITLISPCIPNETANIYLIDQRMIEVPVAIVEYITQLTDTNDSMVEGKPDALPLASRIALFLRNRTDGQSLSMLWLHFQDESQEMIEAALNELDANGVVRMSGTLYYHATNAIFSGSTQW